jgi:hypothetical protein
VAKWDPIISPGHSYKRELGFKEYDRISGNLHTRKFKYGGIYLDSMYPTSGTQKTYV